MTPEQLAHAYVRCFCEGELSELETLLTKDFCIQGPLYTFNDRDSFLQRLRTLNAPGAEHHIRHCTADDNSACVFFDFRLGKLEILMAMHFGFTEHRISNAVLVFDTARLPNRAR